MGSNIKTVQIAAGDVWMYRKRTFLIEYEGFLLPRDSRELRADKGISIYLCSRLIVYVWAKRTLITKSSPCRSVAFTRCTWACPSRATIQGRRVGVELFRRASFPSYTKIVVIDFLPYL